MSHTDSEVFTEVDHGILFLGPTAIRTERRFWHKRSYSGHPRARLGGVEKQRLQPSRLYFPNGTLFEAAPPCRSRMRKWTKGGQKLVQGISQPQIMAERAIFLL